MGDALRRERLFFDLGHARKTTASWIATQSAAIPLWATRPWRTLPPHASPQRAIPMRKPASLRLACCSGPSHQRINHNNANPDPGKVQRQITEMENSWPCATCPSRDIGFCGDLLGTPPRNSLLQQDIGWQEHKVFYANECIATPHDRFEHIYVLCEGWAFRFFQRPDGRRKILRFLLPGDLFDPLTVFGKAPHLSVQALTDVLVSQFNRTELQARLSITPAISKTTINICVDETKNTDEFLIALGIGSAEERIAHLLCHLTNRLTAHSVIGERRYRFPLRQKHIAEAVGITAVHVSRVMRIFHDRRLIAFSDGILDILKPADLERIGCFK